MTTLHVEMAGKTDPGCVRDRNEDSIALDPALGLMIVADGMGGHNSGEVASSLATSTILDYARKFLGGKKEVVPEGGDPKRAVRERQVEYIVQCANTLIFEKARAFPKDHGMGTTLVATVLDSRGILTVGHVGDSRLYLWRNGALQQLTEDHSLVQDQLRVGVITREQAANSHLQNILTRALGTEEKVTVDVAQHPMLPGDSYLLCSDGLNKMVPDPEVAKVLEMVAGPAEAVDRLIDMARAAGGVDNITVAVARVSGEAKPGLKGLLSKLLGQ